MSIKLYVLKTEFRRLLEWLEATELCLRQAETDRATHIYAQSLTKILENIKKIKELHLQGKLIFY